MDELERMRAFLALRQLEAIMGPVDPEPVLLVAMDGGRRSAPRPRARLRAVK